MRNLNLRFFSVRGKNLALGGKAYQYDLIPRAKASETIDGNTTQTSAYGSCPTSRSAAGMWWRIEFDKLIEVYVIEITPGKLEGYQE